jgi:hypothetical protein
MCCALGSQGAASLAELPLCLVAGTNDGKIVVYSLTGSGGGEATLTHTIQIPPACNTHWYASHRVTSSCHRPITC